MTTLDPKPGDWVHLRAQVVEASDYTVLVELFSKTDQYRAHVRPDLVVEIVPKPIPDEPDNGSVVLVDGRAYQREACMWWGAIGSGEARTWVELNALGEVTVIHDA